MHRIVFHVDMDAFFASVEQRDDPALRGKPVVVGSPPDQRGVVCAASYEARRFKVRSAMPSRTAYRLCPHAIFVRPRMDAYRNESHHLMAMFAELSPLLEKVSVDEAYLDVSHLAPEGTDPDEALRLALPAAIDLKQRIRSERHLTASIGIATNKFLAKLGSDYKKPDGLTLIPEQDKVEFLRPLSVRDIHGVGPVTAQALEERGLKTIGDLQDTELTLEHALGSFAIKLKERAFGIDPRPVEGDSERKSISAENTFPADTEHRPTLRAALREMAADIESTLFKHQAGALTIQVKVRYSDFKTLTRQHRLEDPVSSARDIYRLACHLLATNALVDRPLRLLGIGASTLVPAASPRQLHLPFIPQ
jgi:DNA polymerase-4